MSALPIIEDQKIDAAYWAELARPDKVALMFKTKKNDYQLQVAFSLDWRKTLQEFERDYVKATNK